MPSTISEWILCPLCGNKTRLRIRGDTILENFPLLRFLSSADTTPGTLQSARKIPPFSEKSKNRERFSRPLFFDFDSPINSALDDWQILFGTQFQFVAGPLALFAAVLNICKIPWVYVHSFGQDPAGQAQRFPGISMKFYSHAAAYFQFSECLCGPL